MCAIVTWVFANIQSIQQKTYDYFREDGVSKVSLNLHDRNVDSHQMVLHLLWQKLHLRFPELAVVITNCLWSYQFFLCASPIQPMTTDLKSRYMHSFRWYVFEHTNTIL